MPLYMDRHYIEGITKEVIAQAHALDLAIQERYPVKFLTYWFDEPRCTGNCLIVSPDKETIRKAHGEAHGNVPSEIIEVDLSIVEVFLGRVQDLTPVDNFVETPVDSAFRTIMFTDLKDSTLMTTMFGDTKALHLLHIHNALIRNELREHRGSEVKHTGDGIMASFVDVEDAVKCAIAVQKSFADHNQRDPNESLHIRVGLSAGEPVEEDGDLFGSAVQLAARICAHTEPDRILAAQIIRDECPSHQSVFVDLGEIIPKGFDSPIHVHEVQWR
jgi:class 3 adenylate cyclase